MVRTASPLPILLLLAATPAGGDWLILKNGTRIETHGPWTEKGRQVVYTTIAEKRLVSVRAADVDLPASRQASTTEAAVGMKTYQDLGTEPDRRLPPPTPRPNRLAAWIKDPNAPRVSGTISAPTLRLRMEDLVREGEAILADPEAAVESLNAQMLQADVDRYDCETTKAAAADHGASCLQDHREAIEEVRRREEEMFAAIDAAQAEKQRKAAAERDYHAETKRIDEMRATEEKEEREAAEAEKEAQEKAAKEAARAEKRAEESAPPPR